MNERPPIFSLRGLILAIVMVAIVSVLISAELNGLNTYATAYDARIGLYGDKLDSLNKIRSWKERLFMRHVANVEIPTYIVGHLRPNDVVLLPPMSYGNRYMKTNAIWTDPRIFAWMVGFHNVVAWNDTTRRSSANAFVVLNENQIWIARRGGQTNIDSLMIEYGKGR